MTETQNVVPVSAEFLERELQFFFNTDLPITQKQKEMISHRIPTVVHTGYTFKQIIEMECRWFQPLKLQGKHSFCSQYITKKNATANPLPVEANTSLTSNVSVSYVEDTQTAMGTWMTNVLEAMSGYHWFTKNMTSILATTSTNDVDFTSRPEFGSHYVMNEESRNKIIHAKGNFDFATQHAILFHHLRRYTRFAERSNVDSTLAAFELATTDFLNAILNSFKENISPVATFSGPAWLTPYVPFIYDRPIKSTDKNVPVAVTLHSPLMGNVKVFDEHGTVLFEIHVIGASVAYVDRLLYNGKEYLRLLVGTYFGTVFVFMNDQVEVLYYKNAITGIRSRDNLAVVDASSMDTRLAIWTKCNVALLDPRPDKISETFYHQVDSGIMTVLDVTFLDSVLCIVYDSRSQLENKTVPSPDVTVNQKRSEKQFRLFDVTPMEYNSYYTFGIFETQSQAPTFMVRNLKQERLGALHTLPACCILNDAEMLMRTTFGFFKRPLTHIMYMCKKESNEAPVLFTGLLKFSFDPDHLICYTPQ